MGKNAGAKVMVKIVGRRRFISARRKTIPVECRAMRYYRQTERGKTIYDTQVCGSGRAFSRSKDMV